MAMGVSYFFRPTSHDSKPAMRPAKCGPGGVGMDVNGPVAGSLYSLGEVLHWISAGIDVVVVVVVVVTTAVVVVDTTVLLELVV